MCSDKTKGVFLYRPGGKNQNSWRSCLCLEKQNQRHRKQKPFLNTHGLAVLCSSSLLSVARAKAVPIPLIFHLLALGQECTKQLRLLCTWVRGLGGRKGVWRTPTASLLHALHTQSHNPFFSPCLHTEIIFFQSQATLIFPLCNFCRICIYYFCASASFLTVSGGIFKPAFTRDAYFRKLKYDRFSYDCYRPQSHKKTGGIGRDNALLKPESNPISLQFSSGRTDMTQVILFTWYCATGWLHFALNCVCEPTPALTSNRQPGLNKNRPLHCSVDILKEFPVPRPSDDFFRTLPRKLFFPPLLSKKPRNHRQIKTSYQVKVIFK